jgi:hypothetical protein
MNQKKEFCNDMIKLKNKKPTGIIKKIQQKILLTPTETVLIEWRSSYYYETETSRRRGGYSRTRCTYFAFQDNQYHNASYLRPDELTGRFLLSQEMEVYLVPIPDYFRFNTEYEFSLINMKTKNEITLKEKGIYFFGNRESALFLGKFSDSGEVKELGKTGYSSSYMTLDGLIPDWRVFFPCEIVQLKNLFTPYRKIIFQDEEIIQDEILQYSFDIKESEFRIVRDPKLALKF